MTIDTQQVNDTQDKQNDPRLANVPGIRSMEQDWKEFKDGVETSVGEGPPNRDGAPKQEHVDLSGLSPEELDKWQKTGELPGQKKDERAGQEKDKETAEGKPQEDAEKLRSAQQQPAQPQSGYDRLLERASKEPDFNKVVERLHEPFFPLSDAGVRRYAVMEYALQQVPNKDDVIYFLARPENGSVAIKMQDAAPEKIAQTIHMISAELRFGGGNAETRKSVAKPKPRLPDIPADVGGRGGAPRDQEAAALEADDFAAVERIWNAKKFGSR